MPEQTTDVPLTYTQHTKAWPRQPTADGAVDEINVSLDHPEGGTLGELTIGFFDLPSLGVVPQLQVYGDGLACLYDPRFQAFMEAWRADPGVSGVEAILGMLDYAGAVPSRYHTRNDPKPADERIARLRRIAEIYPEAAAEAAKAWGIDLTKGENDAPAHR